MIDNTHQEQLFLELKDTIDRVNEEYHFSLMDVVGTLEALKHFMVQIMTNDKYTKEDEE